MSPAARYLHLLPAAALAIGLGCTAAPGRPSTRPPTLDERLAHLGYKEGAEVDNIQRYSIDGWQSIDSEHFVLDAGPSRYYLITLQFPCSGIGFAENLHFSTTPPGDLTRLDEIIVHQPAVPEHCPIKAINVLDKLKKQH